MTKLSKITTGGKAIYLAYDHGIEHGPIDLKAAITLLFYKKG